MRGTVFADRAAAGRLLARELLRFKGRRPAVLALPRGGVPVGFEIAAALDAPLDVILVRKIGAPWQPELAVGAVVDGDHPETTLNEEIVRMLRISDEYVKEEGARQLAEIARRRTLYLGGRIPAEVAGRVALVVDDGIATGATMRAALRAVRRRNPERLVLAVPVAPPDTIESLQTEVDEAVCLETPEEFAAISLFYGDFPQVSDAEVIALLDRAARRAPGKEAPPAARA